jgi:hypothetical protein
MILSRIRIFMMAFMLMVGFGYADLKAQSSTPDDVLNALVKGGTSTLNFIPQATAISNLRAAAANLPHSPLAQQRDMTIIRGWFFEGIASQLERGLDSESAYITNASRLYERLNDFPLGYFPKGFAETVQLEGLTQITQ